MKFFYPIILVISVLFFLPKTAVSQACNLLTATYQTTESRCASTGTLQINASGGSGNYQYKVNGPVTTNYTSNSFITGLASGRYLVTVLDIVTNCIYNQDSITITGDYLTPGFSMIQTPVTCINGNNGKINVSGQTNGRAPFSYKIVAPSASNVGVVSATGVFTNLLYGAYLVQLSDSCGGIQTRSITVENFLWFINTYPVTKIGCDSINITINLKDDKNNVTPHAVFNGFQYGASKTAGDTTWSASNTFRYFMGNKHSVKLFAKDGCGNIRQVSWSDPAIPSVNTNVSISNRACSTFTARINGQNNLTNPNFCIYNSSNVLIACNTTGTFNNLPYGSYCMTIRDNCYDTTITRCFTATRPVPAVATNVTFLRTCTSFTATITGQTNTTNPNYCLYNAANVLITCNTTGVFSALPFGTYCIRMVNDPLCYDTTITRCFTVNRPIPYAGPVVDISNRTCSTFTASIADTADWNNPQFCLYTPARVLIACNTTGVFNNLPYGSYCIDLINDPVCYDTTITRCFTVNRPLPQIDSWVNISNKTCTTFTAAISGQLNLSDPQYCLYNSANVLISCNTTGTFNAIPYGSYCIKVQNNPLCFDTLITRCFSEAQTPVDIGSSVIKSCTTIGTTDLKINFNDGTPPFTLQLYSPTGVLLQTAVSSASSYTFFSLPGLLPTQKYKCVVTDFCGQKDSVSRTPNISQLDKIKTVTNRCPSASWPNGSADMVFNNTANNIGGTISTKIFKRNGAVVNIAATSNVGYVYTFLNLGPALYIFETYIENCNKRLYDTVSVSNYIFPDLFGSKVYRCDSGSFQVRVNTLGGISPYLYEIFGSVPGTPSIITPPQASPNFLINNGAVYSLIRLRVLDGCGNASLHDANILPLSNFLVFADTLECIGRRLTLRVDSVEGATYTWYKRIVPNDSVIVGTGHAYRIPVLGISDTGRYVCKISIHNGCITKFANYIITATCGGVLPIDVTLTGEKIPGANKLSWKTTKAAVYSYSLQRSNKTPTNFETIAENHNNSMEEITIKDQDPKNGNNYYRLKIASGNNKLSYSNIVMLNNSGQASFMLYPNPVNEMLYIVVSNSENQNYSVEITSILGERKSINNFYMVQNGILKIPRAFNMVSGIYLVRLNNLSTNETKSYKVMFK